MAESGAVFQGVVPATKREVYEYAVPKKYTNDAVKESIGLIRVTGDEELEATKRARGDGVRLAFELVKIALVEVDGRKLNRSEGEDEAVWNKMRPELRQLCLAAYGKLHNAEDDVQEDFLASQKVKVG